MRKEEKSRPLVLVYALIVVLLLFGVAAYYVSNQDADLRDTSLIGDGVCGNLPTDAGQDACCSQAHEKDATTQCVGSWKYIAGIKECQYLCQGNLPECPDDGKRCSDGSLVLRDATNKCYFREC